MANLFNSLKAGDKIQYLDGSVLVFTGVAHSEYPGIHKYLLSGKKEYYYLDDEVIDSDQYTILGLSFADRIQPLLPIFE